MNITSVFNKTNYVKYYNEESLPRAMFDLVMRDVYTTFVSKAYKVSLDSSDYESLKGIYNLVEPYLKEEDSSNLMVMLDVVYYKVYGSLLKEVKSNLVYLLDEKYISAQFSQYMNGYKLEPEVAAYIVITNENLSDDFKREILKSTPYIPIRNFSHNRRLINAMFLYAYMSVPDEPYEETEEYVYLLK